MVWPLTWVVIAGTVPGVLVGVIVRVRYLPEPTATLEHGISLNGCGRRRHDASGHLGRLPGQAEDSDLFFWEWQR